MKNLINTLVISSLFLLVTSCSTNESTETLALENEPQLKSYKIQKDINGRYSIDYTVSSNTSVEAVKNRQSNSNEFYLFTEDINQKQNFKEEVSLENNKIQLDFFENSESKTSFILEDDDINIANGKTYNKYLEEYSFNINTEENLLELDFKVREGIIVSYFYNEELETYEVHLKEGRGGDVLSFNKNFEIDKNILKVDFVNHLNTIGEKNSTLNSRNKPKGIVIRDISA